MTDADFEKATKGEGPTEEKALHKACSQCTRRAVLTRSPPRSRMSKFPF